jgi:hypothetical protein
VIKPKDSLEDAVGLKEKDLGVGDTARLRTMLSGLTHSFGTFEC